MDFDEILSMTCH